MPLDPWSAEPPGVPLTPNLTPRPGDGRAPAYPSPTSPLVGRTSPSSPEGSAIALGSMAERLTTQSYHPVPRNQQSIGHAPLDHLPGSSPHFFQTRMMEFVKRG